MKPNLKLSRFSWALYDFANTIFSMNIVSLYFVLWITVERGCPEIYYSLAFGVSVFAAALIMPIIGELSDRAKRRVPFLIAFTCACCACTALLGLLKKEVLLVLIVFGLANFFYQLAGVSYNALLVQVSTPQTRGKTSGLGVSLGYFGTIAGMHLVRPYLESGGYRATFVPTALLFLLFALPAFIFIKDPPHPHIPKIELTIKAALIRLSKTLSQIRQNRLLVKFLISAFLCLNAVNTIIIYMSVYAKNVMNFSDSAIIYFLSISTVFAIVGSYVFGHVTDLWGAKNTLNLVIKLWCLTIFLAGISTINWMFWLVGILAGICLGATWVCVRPLLIELVPQDTVGQMFGLFGLAGRFAALLGPLVWGAITSWLFADLGVLRYRIAIASVFMFMFCGFLVFQGVLAPGKLALEN